jgi:F0F1-type ATP synthase membrane subunit c/vacuolar-type H+-ATPase subunit K
MIPDDDPGWPRSISVFLLLVPGALQWYLRRHGSRDGLVMLRQLFLTFSFSVVAFGVVIAFVQLPDDAVVPWLPALAAITLVVLVAGRFAEKALDCTGDHALSTSYRQRFFLRIAFPESIALFGFVFVFIGAARWIYYVAAAVTLLCFWTGAAPTRGALARDQEQLNASGCARSLVAALRVPPGTQPE